MMSEFFRTMMGQKFFSSDVPRIASALERIAAALEKLNARDEAEAKERAG